MDVDESGKKTYGREKNEWPLLRQMSRIGLSKLFMDLLSPILSDKK